MEVEAFGARASPTRRLARRSVRKPKGPCGPHFPLLLTARVLLLRSSDERTGGPPWRFSAAGKALPIPAPSPARQLKRYNSNHATEHPNLPGDRGEADAEPGAGGAESPPDAAETLTLFPRSQALLGNARLRSSASSHRQLTKRVILCMGRRPHEAELRGLAFSSRAWEREPPGRTQ